MVRKLYKHEFRSWIRFMGIVYLVMLSMGVMHRLVQLFEADNIYYYILFGSATVAYGLVLYAGFLATVIYSVVRFYKNLFTGEGYLTMTLPVPTVAHLWVKVSTAVLFSLGAYLAAVLSFAVVTAGDVLVELWKAAAYLWNDLADAQTHFALFALEVGAIAVVSLFTSFLLYYTCICVGQLFRKGRILIAIGAFYVYYMIMQLVSTVGSMLFPMLMAIGALNWLEPVVEKLGINTIHVVLGIGFLFSLALGGIYFLACHLIIKKRLNLE